MPDSIETGGSVSTGTPAPQGAPGTASLPSGAPLSQDAQFPGGLPAQGVKPVWSDPVSIMAEVLRVLRYEGPEKAQKLIDFLNSLRQNP